MMMVMMMLKIMMMMMMVVVVVVVVITITGAAVLGGALYAVGGHDGWSYLSSVERYDPEAEVWTHVSSMSAPRSTLGVAIVGNRCVHLANVRFPPFRCCSPVALSPFCRCKIPLFCKNYVRKFRSVTAVNGKKLP